MKINDALNAVNSWYQSIENADQLINYLNQGFCFSITQSQFQTWSAISDVSSLHAYPAVVNGQMFFVLIDNVTDSQRQLTEDTIFESSYTYGITSNVFQSTTNGNSNITFLDALERNFRWQMNKQTWINNTISAGQPVFQSFVIPFTDLSNMFGQSGVTEVYGVIGVSEDKGQLGATDVILWSDTEGFIDPASVEDLSYPVPPFGGSITVNDFQLLVQSNSVPS